MKIILCFGTRPEAIKMASVIAELKNHRLDYRICVTAQHREMLDQALDFFHIVPDYDLNLMKSGQSLNVFSAAMMKGFDDILVKEVPDLVLVQGDTSTAFMAALTAFNRKIKIGHIEAGLRTFRKHSPFPEEANRQLISRIADFHFVPTKSAKANLLLENVPEADIFLTGNTGIDALEYGTSILNSGYKNDRINEIIQILKPEKKLVLVTGHRRENFGHGLEELCKALIELAKRKDVQLLFPVHLNPNVQDTILCRLANQPNIILTEPLDYPTFLWLMKTASVIVSDSGGIQEEAPTFKTPVVVTRVNSERMEGVKAGFSFLAGTSKSRIVDLTNHLLNNCPDYRQLKNPYGDGKAAERIVNVLIGG